MRMKWKGIDATFRSVERQHQQKIKKDMGSRLTTMLALLRLATPKDTGYAASRWRIEGLFPRFRVVNDASYIEYLNQGSSKQAPSFFIESIALRFGKPYGQVVTVMPSNPGSP